VITTVVSSLETVTEIESAENIARYHVWVKKSSLKFVEKLIQGKVGMATVSVKLPNDVFLSFL